MANYPQTIKLIRITVGRQIILNTELCSYHEFEYNGNSEWECNFN